MTVDELELKKLATRFRKLIVDCQPEELQHQIPSINRFPTGTCGDVSDLLGKYLIDHGYLDVEYVYGMHFQQSHGWLEIDGVIIDITGDQFSDFDEAIFVSRDRSYHNRFKDQRRRRGGYEQLNNYQVTRLSVVYNVIISKGKVTDN